MAGSSSSRGPARPLSRSCCRRMRLDLRRKRECEDWTALQPRGGLLRFRVSKAAKLGKVGSSMASKGDAVAVRLCIPAKPEYISLGRLALTGLSRLRTLPDDVLADLKLALTEACTNSVRHAYDGGEG